MSIVTTEVESIHGDIASTAGERLVFFRCQDHLSNWHTYGPVRIAPEQAYTPADHFSEIADRVAEQLAEAEFWALIEADD